MALGFQGLAAKVQTALEENPLGGNVYLSGPSRRSGEDLFGQPRTESGFSQSGLNEAALFGPRPTVAKVHLSAAQLSMLLEGIDWRQPRRTAALSML